MPTNPKLDAIRAATTTEVVASIPADWHPDSTLLWAEPLMAHEGATAALQSGRAALKTLYESMRVMQDAERATREKFGGTLEVSGKVIQRSVPEDKQAALAADLGARFESTAKSFDRHLGVVNDTIESLTNTIERALSPKKDSPATAQAASDIRAYVKNLPDDKRMSFIHGAINEGDLEVAQSLLSTTPWVSGLNREQAAMIKEMAAEKFAPREHLARGAANKLADHLRSSSQNFVQAYRKLQPVLKPSAHAAAIAKLKEAV